MMNRFQICSIIILSFTIPLFCDAQETTTTSETLKVIGDDWKIDSASCKGYRIKTASLVMKSKIDSITKEFLFSYIGNPNKVQKFYSGVTRKNYIGYIFYIYKDNCPKIQVEGTAIQFVFEDGGTYLVEITDIDYCG